MPTEPLIDPSSLTRWRKRVGEAKVEELLAVTPDASVRCQAIKPGSLKTVMPKAVAHPTDSQPLERASEQLVKAAADHGLKLRQNYNREVPRWRCRLGVTPMPGSSSACVRH